MLGPSADSKWSDAPPSQDAPDDVNASLVVAESESDIEGEDNQADNIYVYMGKDYSKTQKKADEAALELLVSVPTSSIE
jgi:hypothetical protein